MQSFLLRVGLATALLYAATASLLDPDSWIGFIPAIFRSIISGEILLALFSIYEAALALWLLSGKSAFYSALLAAATLFFITVFNLGALDIVFRDIAIIFMALALAVLEKPRG